MRNDFDYKLAYKLEEEFREKGDIISLLQISIEFWENLGSMHTIEQRLPHMSVDYKSKQLGEVFTSSFYFW